jgi:THO complex subunit 1
MTELQRRLQRRGSDDEATIEKRLQIAQRELEQAKTEGFHDKIFVNDDLETTYKQLENYVFGIEETDEEPSQLTSNDDKSKLAESANAEIEMVDTEAPEPETPLKVDVPGTDIAKATAEDSVVAE